MAESEETEEAGKRKKARPTKRAAPKKAGAANRAVSKRKKAAPASAKRSAGAANKTSAASPKKASKPKAASKLKKEEQTLSDSKAGPEATEDEAGEETGRLEVVDRVLAFVFYGLLGGAVVHIYLILCVLHFAIAAATGENQKEFQDFLFRMKNWLVEIGDYFSLKRGPRDFPFPAPNTKFPSADV